MTTATPICTDFTVFQRAVHARFVGLSTRELYTTATDGDALFAAYLGAFPPGTNPVVKTRTLYDCQTCKHFVRRLGGVVAIEGGRVQTIWEELDLPEPFRTVAEALDWVVRGAVVTGVFRTKERQYGVDHNYGPDKERHDHFHSGEVSPRHRCDDPEAKRGELAGIHQVFQRGLTEIRPTDLEAVLDLIDSNGLYRGAEHRAAVAGFLALSRAYLASAAMRLFAWEHLHDRNARFRNTVIGTLLTDLADGKDFDRAVREFETKVAPANYKRPTAVITQRMVEQAVQTLTDLGLHGAVARRYARLADVSVNDVLFVDNDSRGKMRDGVAALLESSVKKSAPDLRHAVKIPADEFVANVLPGVKTLEAFVENRHQGNFVSLTGADGPERLFKWGNNFAWSYDGDVADSVKARVKAAGGVVDCKLRVSLSWFNTDDLDLHCKPPAGPEVFFANKSGVLDVDMNASSLVRNPVENLAFRRLDDGVYRVWVNQYRRRETADVGFCIEYEYGGAVHQYSYPKSLKDREDVECFRLHVRRGELVTVETDLTGGAASVEKWGVKTETLVPVAAVMYSPNHWGDDRVGARHLILALKGCVNPDACRGIYNEFLRPDLEAHRKVFEVLGNKTKCPPSAEQVSGVGFTAARGDSVTVVVDGKRAYTLTF